MLNVLLKELTMRVQATVRHLWPILALACAISAAPAQQDREPDDDRIRSLFKDYCRAVEAKDQTRIAALYVAPTKPNGGSATNGGGSGRLAQPILLTPGRRAWTDIFRASTIDVEQAVLKIGIENDRALVRWHYRFSTPVTGNRTRTLEAGVRELLVEKMHGRWRIADGSWLSHNILYDVEEGLRAFRDDPAAPLPSVLQLVIGQRGGTWTPLRAMNWSGEIVPADQAGPGQDESKFHEDLYLQLQEFYDRNHPGFAHLFMQRAPNGWVWVGAVWHPAPAIEREMELHQLNEEYVRRARERLEESFGDPRAHRDMGRILSQQGLYREAIDELEKAEALAPGTVVAAELTETRKHENEDPNERSKNILNLEKKLGPAPDHPRRIIEEFQKKTRNACNAAIIGLEASKWGDDRLAYRQFIDTANLRRQRNIGEIDRDAFEIMFEHLQRRVELQQYKPQGSLRSDRFFVRYHRGDSNVLPLLAALEQAQESIYSTFQMPMAGTEVILFENQQEFRRYRELAQGAATSEYLQAETVTNVLTTQGQLYILSQEVITFPHSGTDMIKTIQHEYGHVAVNRYAKGRFVPDWLNEGIACVTEGGYPKYEERCKKAYWSDTLIPMEALLARANRQQPGQWSFQGDRALLAYSEANALIDFIIRKYGANKLLAVLDNIGKGYDPQTAFRNVLNLDEQTVYNRWRLELAK